MNIDWHFPLARIESCLDEILCVEAGVLAPQRTLREAMRDAVLGGGKRLRAQLVLESASLVSGTVEYDRTSRAACALELIHAYSLVHDDLPAMDDADLRRGRPSCHKIFGEATAILVGDALLTLAFEELAKSGDARVVGLVARAAGEVGMVGGQMIDIAWSNGNNSGIDGETLLQMHAMKTGALIRVSCEAGAILGGGTETEVAALREYGACIGRAFQITDDLLDATGDPNATGKSASDAANDKITATAFFGIAGARDLAQAAADEAVRALEPFDERAKTLRELARAIVKRDK
ncbi:MAG TPA: farnesyl diphosphate synthase [Abditibacteriaceae bacterium]|jgi:geranylgeranyl pyrophosphate synthase